MNAERLLALYDRVADAPDAVDRLRRFVLDLAVRGKLVEQDPADQPATELVKQIATAQARLVKAGGVRSQKPSAPIGQEEMPVRVPSRWTWIRLRDVGTLGGGMTPSKSRPEYWGGEVVWLSPKDIKADFVSDSGLKITKKALSDTRLKLFPSGSLFLVARSGILKRTFPVAINGAPAASNQDLKVLVPFLEGMERYLQLMFGGLTPFILRSLVKTGTTVQSLKYAEFTVQPVPLPPLAEQRRIVAKVDELMVLCDRLEETRAAREDTRDRLTNASYARLTATDTEAAAFRGHARFAIHALPALTARADQVKQLRQTILSLAVRGKLVKQDRKLTPVVTLLANRGIPVSDSTWFEIPETWAWVNVRAVAESRLGKMLDKSKNSGDPRRYLRNVNVRWFDFDLSDVLEMRFEDAELPKFALLAGDVLICEGGEPGRAAVWDEREDDIYFQKAIHRVRFLDIVDGRYFVKVLRASADEGRLAEYFTGTTFKHFTGTALRTYVFPLPPLPEQHRIVTKVNALMALCDRLEDGLDSADGTRNRLLESILHDALVATQPEPTTEGDSEHECGRASVRSENASAGHASEECSPHPSIRTWV